MEAQIQKRPVLVTLTSPSAGGKSYLFNYIRDVAKLPCLISTTTRAPRAGEKEGVDYYFISEEQSKQMEEANLFAELAIYNGVRYGVTKTEFSYKLRDGLAFLIVEPTGIDHYAKPALDVGALHYKTFIHTDPQVRLKRFRERVEADMTRTVQAALIQANTFNMSTMIMKEMNTSLNRLTTMLTEENHWFGLHQWDRILFGEDKPEDNLRIMLGDIEEIQSRQLAVDKHNASEATIIKKIIASAPKHW